MIRATTLCQHFIDVNSWNYEWSTLDVFRQAFRHWVAAVGNREIHLINAMDGERFKGWIVKRGRQKSTANIYLRAIKRVFYWAVETELLKRNPIAGIKQFRITREPVKYYTDEQVVKMIECAPSLEWRGIILCAWSTGLRRGAILNLTRDNIRDGYIYVEAKKKTLRTWPWEPKTKEVRRIPMTDELARMVEQLECYYIFMSQKRYEYLLELQRAEMLSARKRKIPVENILRDLARIQKKAFGRVIGDFHMFRKTFATNMAEELPEHIVMALGGWKCRNTMIHYTGVKSHLLESARIIASERLKRAISETDGPSEKKDGNTAV